MKSVGRARRAEHFALFKPSYTQGEVQNIRKIWLLCTQDDWNDDDDEDDDDYDDYDEY